MSARCGFKPWPWPAVSFSKLKCAARSAMARRTLTDGGNRCVQRRGGGFFLFFSVLPLRPRRPFPSRRYRGVFACLLQSFVFTSLLHDDLLRVLFVLLFFSLCLTLVFHCRTSSFFFSFLFSFCFSSSSPILQSSSTRLGPTAPKRYGLVASPRTPTQTPRARLRPFSLSLLHHWYAWMIVLAVLYSRAG
ncbi:hypothetical protein JOL62DRAFT_272359 [Phyllosticta paracitricarpa]|uniref:Transmembrane protein n=1 Tax=Phyllosticta paracitricarpa TaxID=2016321 RepID=A0ABR1MZK3_9PEZI